MTWILHRQQQQRGAQFPASARRSAGAPDEAVADRAAQDHEQAAEDFGETLPPGGYPASNIEDRAGGDITPTAPEPDVDWDEVVQPDRQQRQGAAADDLPLPEGK